MSDRNKFIDDLIDAGADDDEIEEALKLAESRGEFKPVVTTPEPEPQPQPEPEKKGGFFSDVVHGAKDIVDPIVDNAKGLVSGVQKEAETGGTRYGQAKDPLSKLTAIGGTAARIGGQVLAAPVKLATDETKNFLENIPAYNRGVAALDKKADIGPALSKAGSLAAKAKEATYDRLPNAGKDLVDIGVNTLGFPVLKAEAKPLLGAANRAIEGAGRGIEGAGKDVLAGELKIKKNLAEKGYGKNIDDKKEKMVNDYVKYDLQSPIGNFSKSADKAQELANQRFNKADAIISDLSKSGDKKYLRDPSDVLLSVSNNLDDIAALGKTDQAENIITKIVDDATSRGLSGLQTPDKLVQAKRMLDPDGKLFKSGPSPSLDDALERDIRKRMYLKIVDEVGQMSPEVKQLNREGKELLDLNAITNDASSRLRNNNKGLMGSMAEIGMGSAGGLGAMANPDKAIPILAATGGAMALKRALGQGRGASTMINTGKGLKSLATKDLSEYFKLKDKAPKSEKISNPESDSWSQPITDESRLLPPPMVGETTQKIERMMPSMGDRIRALGESGAKEFDKPIVERIALPSPKDIKKLYPHLSDEDIRNIIYQLDDRKALPAPMIDNGSQLHKFERQYPTLGQRISSIGVTKGKKPSETTFKIIEDFSKRRNK